MPVVEPPMGLMCSITHEIYKDPVITADGQVFERVAIEEWLMKSDRSPMTNVVLESKKLVEGTFVKQCIAEWRIEKAITTGQALFRLMLKNDEAVLEACNWLTSDLSRGIVSEAVDYFMTQLKQSKEHVPEKALKWLVSKGAGVDDILWSTGRSAMTAAVVEDNAAVVSILLDLKASVENKVRKDKGPLCLVKSKEVAVLLINAKADVDEHNDYGGPLCSICPDGKKYFEIVEYLLSQKADPNGTGWYWPLSTATESGNVKAVELLLDAKASMRETSDSCPVFLAAALQSPDILALYCKRGININIRDEKGGSTLLMTAAYYAPQSLSVMKWLLDNKADIDAVDDKGCTALHRACRLDKKSAVTLLLDQFAKVNIKDAKGQFAFQVADAELGSYVNNYATVLRRRQEGKIIALELQAEVDRERIRNLSNVVSSLWARLETMERAAGVKKPEPMKMEVVEEEEKKEEKATNTGKRKRVEGKEEKKQAPVETSD